MRVSIVEERVTEDNVNPVQGSHTQRVHPPEIHSRYTQDEGKKTGLRWEIIDLDL